ncbi:hypothetical protein [Marinobacter halotolerans]|jgi:hypothetical protein|uniref:hypothetical protein n=1 Tax=Marinobacter halotolerans TaxID=1569211 RepID=UPI0012461FA3|nr:hypothetical protein [Marinobacter halotolerans]
MKKLMACIFAVFAVAALAGCENRAIWNDQGKLEEATKDREVWDTKGKMDSGERKIWNDKDGEPVIK